VVLWALAMRRMLAEQLTHVNAASFGLANLFRSVPFLTSLEMSLFLLMCLLSLGVRGLPPVTYECHAAKITRVF
jgi:hypothetical protein